MVVIERLTQSSEHDQSKTVASRTYLNRQHLILKEKPSPLNSTEPLWLDGESRVAKRFPARGMRLIPL
jgi:hypothetical protein